MLQLLWPLLLSTPPSAAAPEPDRAAVQQSEDIATENASENATENGLSARVLFGGGIVPDDNAFTLVGAGIAYERELFGLLALELAVEGIASPVAQTVVLEVVVEKPVEVNDVIGLYFGGGPTAALQFAKGQARPGAGALAMAGVEVFLGGGLEVFVELDAAILYFEQPELETDVGSGVLYRF